MRNTLAALRREAERLCQAEGDAWKALERACEAAGIEVDRKILADLAVTDIDAFGQLVAAAKAAL